MIFLPGEREWIESKQPIKFRGSHPFKFEVCGDCTQLINYRCSLGIQKPWDCLTFPFQPQLVDGELVPGLAKNCSFSPDKLDPRWVKERWDGWQFIASHVDPAWLQYYCDTPVYQE